MNNNRSLYKRNGWKGILTQLCILEWLLLHILNSKKELSKSISCLQNYGNVNISFITSIFLTEIYSTTVVADTPKSQSITTDLVWCYPCVCHQNSSNLRHQRYKNSEGVLWYLVQTPYQQTPNSCKLGSGEPPPWVRTCPNRTRGFSIDVWGTEARATPGTPHISQFPNNTCSVAWNIIFLKGIASIWE